MTSTSESELLLSFTTFFGAAFTGATTTGLAIFFATGFSDSDDESEEELSFLATFFTGA